MGDPILAVTHTPLIYPANDIQSDGRQCNNPTLGRLVVQQVTTYLFSSRINIF